MPSHQVPAIQGLSHEERAFFVRLAALNATFDAARTGEPARSFGHRALSSDALLEAFLQEIQAQKITQ